MYENKSFEGIIEEMLDNVPSDVDKREGSVIYDALAPVAMELAQVYADLDMLIDETFADTASYYYLVKRAAEHGIFAQEGTPAVLEVVVEPQELEIEMGTEFNVGELNYTLTNSLGDGHYLLTCDTSGAEGNNTVDEVIPMGFVEDLESIEIYGIYTAGTDDEDEESLRERYIESFKTAAFGGNKEDYKEKIKGILGVEGCKVYSAKDLLDLGESAEAGQVKCVISATNGQVPAESLISTVQQEIDPTQTGSGDGLAPCGHVVTVTGVDKYLINISADFVLQVPWEDVSETVTLQLSEYLKELARDWDTVSEIVVRRSRVELNILNVEGVLDVDNVKINGSQSNCILDANSIPVLESVVNNGQTDD